MSEREMSDQEYEIWHLKFKGQRVSYHEDYEERRYVRTVADYCGGPEFSKFAMPLLGIEHEQEISNEDVLRIDILHSLWSTMDEQALANSFNEFLTFKNQLGDSEAAIVMAKSKGWKVFHPLFSTDVVITRQEPIDAAIDRSKTLYFSSQYHLHKESKFGNALHAVLGACLAEASRQKEFEKLDKGE